MNCLLSNLLRLHKRLVIITSNNPFKSHVLLAYRRGPLGTIKVSTEKYLQDQFAITEELMDCHFYI